MHTSASSVEIHAEAYRRQLAADATSCQRIAPTGLPRRMPLIVLIQWLIRTVRTQPSAATNSEMELV